MITIIGSAAVRGVSQDYATYRDRVVAAGGSIANASVTQAAFDLLPALPQPVQWLDTRHGLGQDWYSILGAPADAVRSVYGNPTAGVDNGLGSRILAGGAWDGGRTPELGLASDDYTWYMRCYVSSGAEGWLWGDRFDKQVSGNGGWNYLATTLWRSYNWNTDAGVALVLPRDQWFDVFVVKEGAAVTGYLWLNGQEAVLFSVTLTVPIGALSCGIAGGTDSNGVCPPGVRYQAFLRAAAALDASQRAALVAL